MMSQAANQPIVLELADGKEHRLAKISFATWCDFEVELNRWNDRPLNSPVPMEDVLAAASTFRGMRWLVWRSLRVYEPKIQVVQVAELIGGIGMMQEIIQAITDMPEPETSESDPQSPAEAGP